MAKTIEEKANKKYNNPVEPYCCETDNEEQWYRCGLRDGYIEGATDQRKIDIDKACEWFSEHIIDHACYNEMDGWDIHHKEMHEDFRKAMEDES